MKTIICGGRALTDYGLVVEAIHVAGFAISEVVSGACGIDADDPKRDGLQAKGGDALGEDWALFNGVPVRRFYAGWNRLGLKAGPLRNAEMAAYAEALIALPGNKGTANMIHLAQVRKLPVFSLGKNLKSCTPSPLRRSERFFSAMEKLDGPKYSPLEDA